MLQSRHFTVDEFSCHDGEPYPDIWVDDRLQVLCDVLDAIRDEMGEPVVVVCGYRSAAYNEALRQESARRNGGVPGVAQSSQHIQGRAADVRLTKNTPMRNHMLHDAIKIMYSQGKIPQLGGLGFYDGLWVHVDVRFNNGHLAQWTGSGTGSDK